MKKSILIWISVIMSILLADSLFAIENNSNEDINFDGSIPLATQDFAIFNQISTDFKDLSLDWKNFKKENESWTIYFNKLTSMPHRAFGKPIQIEGFTSIDKNNINEAAMKFIDRNSSLFGFTSSDIKIRKSLLVNNIWSVSFNQIYQGIEVLLTEVELRIRPDGKVMAFGIDYYKDIDLDVEPLISSERINQIAVDGLNINNKTDKVQSTGELFILPKKYSDKVSYHLTNKVLIDIPNTNQKYNSFVDVQSGELIWRRSMIANLETPINVSAGIKRKSRLDNETEEIFKNFKLTVENQTYYTNVDGLLMLNKDNPVVGKATMEGIYAKIIHNDMTNASTTFNILPGQQNTINWNNDNSHRFERYLYYHTTSAHDFYKSIDPNSNAMDFQIKITIRNSGSPNAFSETDQGNITYVGVSNPNYFFVESPSILYHEYGHSVNTRLYKELGISAGMINMSCHEATADLNASLMIDEHRIGYLAFKDTNTVIRNLINNYEYPKDIVGESHHDGQILAGAFWDLRLATNLDYVRWLVHYTKKMGTPDDIDVGIAFNEWFIEALITDDSYGDGDNDLSNGTPNAENIIKAFNRHKIGSNLAMSLTYSHTPLTDTDETIEPYEVIFNLSNPLTFLNSTPQNVKVIYSIDNFKNSFTADATEILDGQYSAQIPPYPNGTFMQYYIVATDPGSNDEIKFSQDMINFKPYIFLIGYNVGTKIDFENSDGWTLTANGDKATKGVWEIGYPSKVLYGNSILLQPDTDPSGLKSKCLVTGAKVGEGTQGILDNMPNGITSAISPTFDISNTLNPVIQFYKFYTNYLIFQLSKWKTYFSFDAGNTWVLVENTSISADNWTQMVYLIENYVPKSTRFRIKFVFETITVSNYPGSLSEGLVDDITILSANEFPNITEVKDEINSVKEFAVFPNPSSDIVNIKIPESLEISSLKLVDLLGNEIIIINNPLVSNGTISVSLMNEQGQNLTSGIYFVIVNAKKQVWSEKIIIR